MVSQFFLCLLGIAVFSAQAAEIVPGKGFDRFITIWLENEVRDVDPPSPCLTIVESLC